MTQRRLLSVCVTICLLFAAALPHAQAQGESRDVIVKMKDGKRFIGTLVEQNDQTVVVSISNIKRSIPRAEIEDVDFKPTTEEQYKLRKQLIQPDNVDERYGLATWLYREKAYVLARAELEELMKLRPDDGRIQKLAQLVTQAEEDAKKAASAPAATDPATTTAPKNPVAAPPKAIPGETEVDKNGLPTRRLTVDQIKQLQVYELEQSYDDGNLGQPNVEVPNDVIDELFEKYREDPAMPAGDRARSELKGAKGWRKVELLFKVKAAGLYSKIKVHDDPPVVKTFRANIHRQYVLGYCGTNECHGGKNAGSFFLFGGRSNNPNDIETVYTNYYILRHFESPAGYMLDFDPDHTSDSYLIQYAMSREVAKSPHPDVPGWRPLYRSTSDPRLTTLREWIRSLPSTKPKFPVTYEPPRLPKPEPEVKAGTAAPAAPATP